jgi:hypothetical protein
MRVFAIPIQPPILSTRNDRPPSDFCRVRYSMGSTTDFCWARNEGEDEVHRTGVRVQTRRFPAEYRRRCPRWYRSVPLLSKPREKRIAARRQVCSGTQAEHVADLVEAPLPLLLVMCLLSHAPSAQPFPPTLSFLWSLQPKRDQRKRHRDSQSSGAAAVAAAASLMTWAGQKTSRRHKAPLPAA